MLEAPQIKGFKNAIASTKNSKILKLFMQFLLCNVYPGKLPFFRRKGCPAGVEGD